MSSNHKPLTDEELEQFEDAHDLGAALLESVRQMQAGMGTVVYSPIMAVRQKSGLTQSQFSTLLGVSQRTLQEWEQGRRTPSGAAKTLLRVAEKHPEVLRELTA
ncbi:MAG: helix-turn-helix domain-containing protein [Sulfuricellaceae bacterium]